MKKLMMVLIAFACANVWASDAWYLGTWEGDWTREEESKITHGMFVAVISADGAMDVQWTEDDYYGDSRDDSGRILSVLMLTSNEAELSFNYDGCSGTFKLKKGKESTFLMGMGPGLSYRKQYGSMKQTSTTTNDGSVAWASKTWTLTPTMSATLDNAGRLTINGTGDMPRWTDRNMSPWFDRRGHVKSVVIAEGVTSIGPFSFKWCTLDAIKFPSTLKRLDPNALSDISGLTEFDFSGTALECAGCAAFTCPDDVSLKSVCFPPSLTQLGAWAFANHRGLNSVYFEGGIPQIVYDDAVVEEVWRERPWLNSLFLWDKIYIVAAVYDNSRIMSTVTTYVKRGRGWDDIVATGTWQGCPIKFVDGEIPQGGDVDPGDWTVAHNFSGVVYDAGENCVGMIQIAMKKATKKGVGVSGTMMLQDGKKITLKSMTVTPESGVLNVAWTVKGYGMLNVTVGAEGFSGQFEEGGFVESQELDEDTGVLKASVTMTYIDKKTKKLKTKKITFGGFVSGGEGFGTVQAGKKDPIKEVEFTVR